MEQRIDLDCCKHNLANTVPSVLHSLWLPVRLLNPILLGALALFVSFIAPFHTLVLSCALPNNVVTTASSRSAPSLPVTSRMSRSSRTLLLASGSKLLTSSQHRTTHTLPSQAPVWTATGVCFLAGCVGLYRKWSSQATQPSALAFVAFASDRDASNTDSPDVAVPEPPTTPAPAPEPPPRASTPDGGAEEPAVRGSGREAGGRLQRLRDLAWTKEVTDDIAYAEFAMAVNPTAPLAPDSSAARTFERRGIDYFKIADKLDTNLERMKRRPLSSTLDPDEYSGLMERLRMTKESIDQFMTRTHRVEGEGPEASAPSSPKARPGSPPDAGAEDKKGRPLGLELFVREDGTMDWDGAMESGRELALFGKEVWERLNGRAVEEGAEPGPGRPLPPADDSPTVQALVLKVVALEASLGEALQQREATLEQMWALRAADEPVPAALRTEMRACTQAVLEARRRLSVQRLDLDMERICHYLEQEIAQSQSLQEQKMLVAEFGLLDRQLRTLLSILEEWEGPDIVDDVDDSELHVLEKEVSELKVRLGFEMEGTRIDWGKLLLEFVQDSTVKLKEGVAFYVKGTRLLVSDVMYALWLVKRTTEGYTLKPREVRTIRRTVKDVLTFIPALIILIIPLSPVGHVLVFSFIQRFFPDFFPTAFSDRRQNLLKLYEEIERKPSEEAEATPRPS